MDDLDNLDDMLDDLFGDEDSEETFEDDNLFDDFDGGFGDFDEFGGGQEDLGENKQGYGEEPDSKEVYKSSAIMIAVGVGIVIVGILLSIFINRIAGKKNISMKEDIPKDIGVNNSILNNNEKQGSNWVKFSESNSEIEMVSEFINATFTITDVEHYVSKASNSGDRIVVKTILIGNISGFSGTYELDIPYTKGIKLSEGNTFNVKVQHGKYGDKTVVGEIKY